MGSSLRKPLAFEKLNPNIGLIFQLWGRHRGLTTVYRLVSEQTKGDLLTMGSLVAMTGRTTAHLNCVSAR